jgi:hypothetical protein
MPDTGSPVGGGGSGGDDPEGAFDKSLGDFDGEIAREREGIASAGRGSGRSAAGREAGDAGAVKTAGSIGRASRGGMSGDDAGAEPGDAGGASADSEGTQPGNAGGENAGAGQAEVKSGAQGSGAKGDEQQGTPAADIPDDIPADGTGEDQVARQLREAAMAEKDPVVREALWEQYRRHTGIRK